MTWDRERETVALDMEKYRGKFDVVNKNDDLMTDAEDTRHRPAHGLLARRSNFECASELRMCVRRSNFERRGRDGYGSKSDFGKRIEHKSKEGETSRRPQERLTPEPFRSRRRTGSQRGLVVGVMEASKNGKFRRKQN